MSKHGGPRLPLMVSAHFCASFSFAAVAQFALAAEPSVEEQVVTLVNEQRLNNGRLPPLKHGALLATAAEKHSSNMANRDFLAHCDPDTGTLPWDRMTDVGYVWSRAGENIAAGYTTASAVVDGWMNSSGHRANILSTDFREIGIGYVYQSGDGGNVRQDANGDCVADTQSGGPYYRYWTQDFGTRGFLHPVVINREAFETQDRQVDLYLYGSG